MNDFQEQLENELYNKNRRELHVPAEPTTLTPDHTTPKTRSRILRKLCA